MPNDGPASPIAVEEALSDVSASPDQELIASHIVEVDQPSRTSEVTGDTL
jgi:hypothetical protein